MYHTTRISSSDLALQKKYTKHQLRAWLISQKQGGVFSKPQARQHAEPKSLAHGPRPLHPPAESPLLLIQLYYK